MPVDPKRGKDFTEVAYLVGRTRKVTTHFEAAIGIDDFLHRLEIALFAFGFNGDNSIAMVNLCRDEITATLKLKIDQLFGSSFNTNGLGGVLTCGATGMGAGLSHAPVSASSGKERYVFLSFPHISINARGEVGPISRPGRPGMSCACGALNQALVDIKSDGLTTNCRIPGVHEPLDPEFSILKQRLARRLRYEGETEASVSGLSLVDITKVAERTITDDLEYLISHTVDPRKADYAVVTGIQIHNWGEKFDDDSPNLEFVAPASVYVVVNGEKTHLDLGAMPSLTPRQVSILAAHATAGAEQDRPRGLDDHICNSDGNSTLREIDSPYLYNSREVKRKLRARTEMYASLIGQEGLQADTICVWPSWQTYLRAEGPQRHEDDNSALHIDHKFSDEGELDEIYARLQGRYASGGNQRGDSPNGSAAPDGRAPQS